jgi:hypothetical protein
MFSLRGGLDPPAIELLRCSRCAVAWPPAIETALFDPKSPNLLDRFPKTESTKRAPVEAAV